MCLLCFLLGIIFTTGAGEYWLKLFDSFAGTIGLVVVALMEMISVIFIYGHEKFTQDIYDMTGYRPGLFWQVTWRFLAPVIMTIILISSIVFMVLKNPTYQAWVADKVMTCTYQNVTQSNKFTLFTLMQYLYVQSSGRSCQYDVSQLGYGCSHINDLYRCSSNSIGISPEALPMLEV